MLRSFRDTINLIDLNCSSKRLAPISKTHITQLFEAMLEQDLTSRDVRRHELVAGVEAIRDYFYSRFKLVSEFKELSGQVLQHF